MLRNQFLRGLVVPSAVVLTHSEAEDNAVRCRPADLPIYTKEPESIPPEPELSEEPAEPNALERAVGSVRRTVFAGVDQARSLQGTTVHYISTGLAHSQGVIDYLSEEENTLPRYGAVAVGTMTGFIFGLRRGRFVRLLFASAGGLSMAAICYPKLASKYTELTLDYTRKYSMQKDNAEPAIAPLGANFVSNAWQSIRDFGQSKDASSENVKQDEVVLLAVTANESSEVISSSEYELCRENSLLDAFEQDVLFVSPQIPQKPTEK